MYSSLTLSSAAHTAGHIDMKAYLYRKITCTLRHFQEAVCCGWFEETRISCAPLRAAMRNFYYLLCLLREELLDIARFLKNLYLTVISTYVCVPYEKQPVWFIFLFQLVVSSLQIFATKVWIWLLASFLIYTFWYFGLKLHMEMVTTKENAQYQPSQIDFFPAQAVVNQGIPSLNTVKTTLHILYLHCDNEL